MQGLLTLFSETTTYNLSRKAWKKKKKKKTRSSQKKKLSHQAHDVKITSYWHQCDVVTSRRTDISMA